MTNDPLRDAYRAAREGRPSELSIDKPKPKKHPADAEPLTREELNAPDTGAGESFLRRLLDDARAGDPGTRDDHHPG